MVVDGQREMKQGTKKRCARYETVRKMEFNELGNI